MNILREDHNQSEETTDDLETPPTFEEILAMSPSVLRDYTKRYQNRHGRGPILSFISSNSDKLIATS